MGHSGQLSLAMTVRGRGWGFITGLGQDLEEFVRGLFQQRLRRKPFQNRLGVFFADPPSLDRTQFKTVREDQT